MSMHDPEPFDGERTVLQESATLMVTRILLSLSGTKRSKQLSVPT